jgi:hypothetical protein
VSKTKEEAYSSHNPHLMILGLATVLGGLAIYGAITWFALIIINTK